MENIKNKLKELTLKESLDLVFEVIKDNEIFLFKNRLNHLKRENKNGLVTPIDYDVRLNTLYLNWMSHIDELTDEQLNNVAPFINLDIPNEELSQKLQTASVLLSQWKSEFENTNSTHLDRKETSQLFDWINTPLSNEALGIATLVGEAGSGKSVILRDLMLMLEAQETPVLGIKADRYCVSKIQDLEARLHLEEGIEIIIKTLVRDKGQVVVLIDQIDALSQSLSAQRDYLDTFIQLIKALSYIEGVKIVISCRKYDIENDQDFSFYRRQKTFNVGKLTDEDIKLVLDKLPCDMSLLPKNLKNLLAVPLQLDVFCRIYRPDFPLQKMHTLKDLFDELWLQKVEQIENLPPSVKSTTSEQCKNLAYALAKQMYEDTRLSIQSKKIERAFPNEIKYLNSQGLIQKNKEGIAFFHQTFYDYVFAKQFVERGLSIEKYLLENGQSLHIRACLKMIIEFLRDSDKTEYLRVYRNILSSPDYYYHIKFLMLSLLGFVKNPNTAEIDLVLDIIQPNPILFKAFLGFVNSREWLLFLFEEKALERFIEENKPYIELSKNEQEQFNFKVESLNRLLRRNISDCTDEILKFLWTLPEFDVKTWLVEMVLHEIKIWDNPMTFKLFDKYDYHISNVFVPEMLKRAAVHNLSWTLSHLRKVIMEQVKAQKDKYGNVEFEYSLAKLIEELIEEYPEHFFDLLLDAQILLNQERKKYEQYYDCDIVNDLPFGLNDFSRDGGDNLFNLLTKVTLVLAKDKSDRFTSFVKENLHSNSKMRLLILVEGFRQAPSLYVSDILRFISDFINKKRFESNALAWRVRQLLKETYSHFTELQKFTIIHLLSQIESDKEKQWAIKNDNEEWIGYFRLTWLMYIPLYDIAQLPNVKTEFDRLSLLYPNFEDYEPNRMRFSGVGAPLSEKEYDTMTHIQWKSSFLKYNTDNDRNFDAGTGGITEHARQFEAEVKKRPDFFYALIDELTSDNRLQKDYLTHGMSGLVEAKYDVYRVFTLFKKIDVTDWENSHNVLSIVRLCGYFIDKKIDDDYLFYFLVKTAKGHTDPVDDSLTIRIQRGNSNKTEVNESIFSSGFNSVRGFAAYLLVHCIYFEQHKNLLFETLEYVSENDLLKVRAQIMPNLAVLMNLDKERTLLLFLKLTEEGELVVLEHASSAAQYLSRYDFDRLKPYFLSTLEHINLHKNTAIILSLAWLFEHDDAIDLLNLFLQKSDEAKAGAIEVAAYNIINEEDNPILRSIELFERFFEDANEVVIHAYDSAFRKMKKKSFSSLLDTLTKFKKSAVIRKSPRTFFEYLIKCATKYPEECLELIEDFDIYEKPNIQSGGYYDKEPLKVVINAYSALWGRKKRNDVLLKKALLLYDRMLLDDRFHGEATKILEEVEQ